MPDSKKIAFLVAPEGIERVELTDPWDAVSDAGHEPVDLPFPRDPTATAVNDHRRRILANLTAPAREPVTAVLPAPDKEPSR